MISAAPLQWAAALRRHPFRVVLLMAILCLAAAYGASKSQVDNSLEVWQSENDPGWLAYQQFLQRTQVADQLYILIPEGEVKAIQVINDALIKLPNVASSHVVEIETVQGKRSTLIALTPQTEATPGQLQEILRQLSALFEVHQVDSYHLGGVWYLTNQLDTLSAKSTAIFFPVVLIVVGLAVLLLCRGRTLLILSCGLLPALFLIGIMGFFRVKLNIVLLALPPLTLILGLAHGIHFSIKRWHTNDSPLTIFARVALPCSLSGLTTALGFASLLLSDYQPVRQLGSWGAVGALISLLITFVLVPTFLKKDFRTPWLHIPGKSAAWLARNRKTIWLFLVAALVLAVLGLSRLQTGSLILDFFLPGSAIRQNYQAIEEAGIGLTPMEIDLHNKPRTRDALVEPLHELARINPEISHFIFTMTDGSQQIESLGAQLLVPDFSFSGQKIDRIRVLVETFSSEKTLAMADRLENFLQTNLGRSETPYVTGSVPLYSRGQKELFKSMLQSFSGAFLAISLVIGIMLRSWKMACIAMVPNLLPVLLVIAVMGWVAIPLSVATMTVASIIFGIVVDDTIHFLHCWQMQEEGISDVAERLGLVFKEVGPPIITTTLVTGTGFLAFLAAPFIPLRHFGLLISLALWMALLCDLCILPVLLIGGKKHVQPNP